jgi:hypothetical protein
LPQLGADADRTKAPLPAGKHVLFGKSGVTEQAIRGQPLQDLIYHTRIEGARAKLRPQFSAGMFPGRQQTHCGLLHILLRPGQGL